MGIRLEVNGITIEATKGETILAALNRNGMRVPTICNLKHLSPSGACRMCVVEVEGRDNLVPACSFPVDEPLRIQTHSSRVLRARKTNVELLLSNHPDDCLYCERNGSCELQSLAEDLNIRERRIPGRVKSYKVDKSSPAIILDPAKCILCGRCVRICEEIMRSSTLDFANRGNELRISTTMNKPLHFSNCTACGQCLIWCPTGALIENVQFPELDTYIHSTRKVVVAHYSAAVGVSVAEQLGYKPGTDMGGIIHAALRRFGFDHVFENAAGAEIMMMEQAKIFNEQDHPESGFPLMSSSCPAWVQYVEQQYPELVPYLSPLRSPQQIMGRLIREWFRKQYENRDRELVSVHITSCTAAKREAGLPELSLSGIPVIDLVMTTRELARLIKLRGLDLERLKPEPADVPFHTSGSAGKLTGVAGGEVEATMRTLYRNLTGKELAPSRLHRFRIRRSYREMVVKAGSNEIRLGAVSGLANAADLIGEIRSGRRKPDLLEVMACPDGCVNGGGQPLPVSDAVIRSRTKALYDIDNGSGIRTAHLNPATLKLYSDFLGEPGGKISRSLFYTTAELQPEHDRESNK